MQAVGFFPLESMIVLSVLAKQDTDENEKNISKLAIALGDKTNCCSAFFILRFAAPKYELLMSNWQF